jgi:hypothetical protein
MDLTEPKTHDSDKSSTDTKSNDEPPDRPRPNLDPHPPQQPSDTLLILDIRLFDHSTRLPVDKRRRLWPCSRGRGRLVELARKSAGRHELLDKGEEHRDDDGGFYRLSCYGVSTIMAVDFASGVVRET